MLKHNLQSFVVLDQLADGIPNIEPLLGTSAGGSPQAIAQLAAFEQFENRRGEPSGIVRRQKPGGVFLGRKISRVPPTSVATTATPDAAASSSTRPSGSCRAECTSNVNSFNSNGTSSRRPRK